MRFGTTKPLTSIEVARAAESEVQLQGVQACQLRCRRHADLRTQTTRLWQHLRQAGEPCFTLHIGDGQA